MDIVLAPKPLWEEVVPNLGPHLGKQERLGVVRESWGRLGWSPDSNMCRACERLVLFSEVHVLRTFGPNDTWPDQEKQSALTPVVVI